MWQERPYLDGASKNPSVRVIQNGLEVRNDAPKKIEELRAIQPPRGLSVSVGGTPALEQDSIHSLFAKLPLMVVLLITTTTILMFLAFGSVVLPIKAAVMSALTLGSTMGVLTWMFVDGHGSGLMNYTPQPLMAPMIGLIIAVIWGLSTDYEVFLVSRMVEARGRGMSTAEAIRIGTATTGRLITGAALVLAVVAGAFVFSDLVMMKYLAFGLLLALLLDATVVRMFLVPAVMKLLGDDCWWAPTLDEAASGTARPRRDRAARRAQAARGTRRGGGAGRCRCTTATSPFCQAAATARPQPSRRRGFVPAGCRHDADSVGTGPRERAVGRRDHPDTDSTHGAGRRAADDPAADGQQREAPQCERIGATRKAGDTAATPAGGPRNRVVAGRIARQQPRCAATRAEAAPAAGRRADHRDTGTASARRPTRREDRRTHDRDNRATATGSGSDREADRAKGDRGRDPAPRRRRQRRRPVAP